MDRNNVGRSVVDHRFAGHREYYETAFAAEYRSIWGGIERVCESRDDLASLCYYRALTSFYDRDPVAVTDRRKLLYAYCAGVFNTNDDDATLNRYRRSLPIDSQIRRVIGNIATAYAEPPKRKFAVDTGATWTDRMSQLYEEMKFAATMRSIHRRARLTSLVAVRPMVVDGKMRMDYMTPDHFRVIVDGDDFRTPVGIVYPKLDAELGIVYERWDRDTMTTIGSDGATLEQIENPYRTRDGVGVLPFAFVRLDDDLTVYPGGMLEIVEAQLDANKAKLLSNQNVDFASSPVWFGINLKNQNIRITPDALVTFDGVTEGEGQLIPPSLESISPEGRFAELDEFRAARERRAALGEGIPASMMSDQVTTPPSGIARVIERSEVVEMRLADQVALREFESQFARIVAIVANNDLGDTIPVDAIVVSVDYAEERVYQEPDAEYSFDKQKLEDGVIDPVDFFRKWSGFDQRMTEEDMIAEIARRRAVVAVLKSADALGDDTGSGEPSPTPPTEPVDPSEPGEPGVDNSPNDPPAPDGVAA
jgi:hypothetical protein